jgi:hypothetical protein
MGILRGHFPLLKMDDTFLGLQKNIVKKGW